MMQPELYDSPRSTDSRGFRGMSPAYYTPGLYSMTDDPNAETMYIKRFFPMRADLYTTLLVSLCESLQREAEQLRDRVIHDKIKSSSNKIKAAINAMAKFESTKFNMPERSSTSFKTVANNLNMIDKGTYPTVNGHTFNLSMFRSNVTQEIFRSLQAALEYFKEFPEILPPFACARLVIAIQPSIVSEDGEFTLDLQKVLEIMERYEGLPINAVKHADVVMYCRLRHHGRTPEEAMEELASDVVAKKVTATKTSVQNFSPGSGRSISFAEHANMILASRPSEPGVKKFNLGPPKP